MNTEETDLPDPELPGNAPDFKKRLQDLMDQDVLIPKNRNRLFDPSLLTPPRVPLSQPPWVRSRCEPVSKWDEFVRQVTYKPGFTLEVEYAIDYNEDRLHISAQVLDSRQGEVRWETHREPYMQLDRLEFGADPYDEPRYRVQNERLTYYGRFARIVGCFTLEPWDQFDNDVERLGEVRRILRNFEEHEMDEWLKFDGELVFDPHSPQGMENARRV